MTSTAQHVQWFAFTAFNSQAFYGTGTAAEADAYADILNEGKEINHYHPKALTAAEADELDLENNSEAFALEDELRAHEDEE